MLVTLAGKRQILVVSARRAMGLTVENGSLLWEYPWSNYNGITVAQPLLLGDDRVFLSAGYGMNYSPSPGSHEMFTNVFVPRWAYQEFVSSGKWPDQTMFVIDERDAQSKGSINKTGHFQTKLMGLAVEVKDSTHFPESWAYFGFDENDKTSAPAPKGNSCFSCHEAHAAVEHTFVQFYPTLLPIARSKGTLKASYQKETETPAQK